MPDLRPEEEWAATMLRRCLGVPVRQHDDCTRPKMFDLLIDYPDRVAGAAEVVAAVDSDSVELRAAIDPGQPWLAPELTGGWVVSLESTARGKGLRGPLTALLHRAESRSMTWLRLDEYVIPDHDHLTCDHPDLLYRAAMLGVRDAFRDGSRSPGTVHLRVEQPLEQTTATIDPSAGGLSNWVTGFVTDPHRHDVLSKLECWPQGERHVVVVLPTLSSAPPQVVYALIKGTCPEDEPTLPRVVTDAWLLSVWGSSSVLWWRSGRGWRTCPQAR